MIWWLLGALVALLVVFALLAPLESLRWWSSQGAVQARRTLALTSADAPGDAAASRQLTVAGEQPDRYVVYLSGIGCSEPPQACGRGSTSAAASVAKAWPRT